MNKRKRNIFLSHILILILINSLVIFFIIKNFKKGIEIYLKNPHTEEITPSIKKEEVDKIIEIFKNAKIL